jgi:tetraacyldisaccharide 4'-kinase
MSRGYKRRTQGFLMADENTNAIKIGDEPMQYYLKFPEVAVSVAEERITGIPTLLQRRPEIEVVLLDDAYQHRSVKAGITMLITDYSNPFYTDYILPYGSLRESRKAYHRADVIIVSKCPQNLDENTAHKIELQINPQPHQQVFFTTIQYETPYDFYTHETVALNKSNVVLVCGIAKPEPLVAHLQQTSESIHILSYPDHHYFLSKDLEELRAAYQNWDVKNKLVVTTEKDAARLHLHIQKLKEWGIPIVVLPISIAVLLGKEEAFNSKIVAHIEQTLAENNMV